MLRKAWMPPAKVKIQRIEVRACARGRGAGGGRDSVGCGVQLQPVPHPPLWLLAAARPQQRGAFWRDVPLCPYSRPFVSIQPPRFTARPRPWWAPRDKPYQTLPKPKTINPRARARMQGDRVRQNTFHKRKMGLIKKAMELTVRCTRNAAPLA